MSFFLYSYDLMLKAQSAIEYLTTYGWALLIVAVVALGLFQLGIFNNANSGRATAGACSVLRPYGGGTTQLVSLQGACDNALPEYVGVLSGSNAFLSGPIGGTYPYGNNAITIVAWIQTSNSVKQVIFSYGNEIATGSIFAFGVGATGAAGGASTGNPTADFYSDGVDSGTSVKNGNWHFVGVSIPYNSVTANFVIDGTFSTNSVSTIHAIQLVSSTKFQIGRWVTVGSDQGARAFNGSIANIQIYNIALNSNQVNALYLNGIGGSPSYLSNLVAWYPLNGNGQDYSGNGYNTTFSNITYTTSWTNGYKGAHN